MNFSKVVVFLGHPGFLDVFGSSSLAAIWQKKAQ